MALKILVKKSYRLIKRDILEYAEISFAKITSENKSFLEILNRFFFDSNSLFILSILLSKNDIKFILVDVVVLFIRDFKIKINFY